MNETFKQYLDELLPVDERLIALHVRNYGHVGAIEKAIEDMKACQEIYPNGVHRCQTDSERYAFNIKEAFYLLNNELISDDTRHEYIKRMEKIHEENLLFEIEHPRIDYSDKKKIKLKKQKYKESPIFTDEEQGKVIPARREKKLKIDKSKFNFMLKI